MPRKKSHKDICPRCQKLKVMPEMNYGKYKEICRRCTIEMNYPPRNALLAFALSVIFTMGIIALAEIKALSEQLTRAQEKICDLESRTELLK